MALETNYVVRVTLEHFEGLKAVLCAHSLGAQSYFTFCSFCTPHKLPQGVFQSLNIKLHLQSEAFFYLLSLKIIAQLGLVAVQASGPAPSIVYWILARDKIYQNVITLLIEIPSPFEE